MNIKILPPSNTSQSQPTCWGPVLDISRDVNHSVMVPVMARTKGIPLPNADGVRCGHVGSVDQSVSDPHPHDETPS